MRSTSSHLAHPRLYRYVGHSRTPCCSTLLFPPPPPPREASLHYTRHSAIVPHAPPDPWTPPRDGTPTYPGVIDASGLMGAALGERRHWEAMDFAAQEAVEGLRFAWNAWPNSRIEASRLVRTSFILFLQRRVTSTR